MLPQDPMILFSYLNTQLRDNYPTLDALCDALDADKQELCQKLAAFGFAYDAEKNKFV